MSFIKARGEEAAKAAQKEKPSYEKLLKTFKSGDAYKVRIATAEDYAMYEAHGLYVKGGRGIFTTPCVHGTDCPYCQAVKQMYNQSDKTGDEEVRGQAGQLKAKERYLFGFVNLADGQPLILDFSKKQAAQLTATIQKNAKKIANNPFEITKSGAGQSTVVALDRLDEEDLSADELKHFQATASFAFTDEMFEVLQVKSIEEGITDLREFGWSLTQAPTNAQLPPSTNPAEDLFAEFLEETTGTQPNITEDDLQGFI